MLSALSPESVARMRFPLAELTKPEVRALAARGGLPVAAAAGLAGSLLPGRHGQGAVPGAPRRARGRARARSSSAPASARRPRRLPSLHRRPAQGARRRRRPSRCTSCGPRRARTASSSARATSWPSGGSRVRGARLHRPGAEVDAVRLRYHSRAVPCRVAGSPAAGTHRAELELDEPFYGAAPGQSACLLRGDVIVGWATITR